MSLRSPLMRAVAVAAALLLVLTHWQERDGWFWAGLVLAALNLLALWRSRSAVADDASSHRLVDLLSSPGVASALAAGPQLWRQVSHLEDERFDPVPVEELAEFVWLERDHEGWSIGLGDEAKPYLDLDTDEREDPVIAVLRSHPAVHDACHEDREVYRTAQHRPLGAADFAELAARALVSHHVAAASRS